jgi:hypothetical protein
MKFKIQDAIKAERIYDIAKVLHFVYPDVSTERIYQLILERNSLDQAIIILQEAKNMSINVDELIRLCFNQQQREL